MFSKKSKKKTRINMIRRTHKHFLADVKANNFHNISKKKYTETFSISIKTHKKHVFQKLLSFSN